MAGARVRSGPFLHVQARTRSRWESRKISVHGVTAPRFGIALRPHTVSIDFIAAAAVTGCHAFRGAGNGNRDRGPAGRRGVILLPGPDSHPGGPKARNGPTQAPAP